MQPARRATPSVAGGIGARTSAEASSSGSLCAAHIRHGGIVNFHGPSRPGLPSRTGGPQPARINHVSPRRNSAGSPCSVISTSSPPTCPHFPARSAFAVQRTTISAGRKSGMMRGAAPTASASVAINGRDRREFAARGNLAKCRRQVGDRAPGAGRFSRSRITVIAAQRVIQCRSSGVCTKQREIRVRGCNSTMPVIADPRWRKPRAGDAEEQEGRSDSTALDRGGGVVVGHPADAASDSKLRQRPPGSKGEDVERYFEGGSLSTVARRMRSSVLLHAPRRRPKTSRDRRRVRHLHEPRLAIDDGVARRSRSRRKRASSALSGNSTATLRP